MTVTTSPVLIPIRKSRSSARSITSSAARTESASRASAAARTPRRHRPREPSADRRWQSRHRRDRLDRATMAHDGELDLTEGATGDAPQRFGIQTFAGRRRELHPHEDGRNRLPHISSDRLDRGRRWRYRRAAPCIPVAPALEDRAMDPGSGSPGAARAAADRARCRDRRRAPLWPAGRNSSASA